MIFNFYTKTQLRKLLNALLTETFPALERQEFQKTPFSNDYFEYDRSLGYEYTFYKLSAPYIIRLIFNICNKYPSISISYNVFKITDMPELLDEMTGHLSFFDHHGKSVYELLHRWKPFSGYELSLSTPFEFCRKREITALRKILFKDLSDIDKVFDRYIEYLKKESLKILVCDRYGIISNIPGQEKEAIHQRVVYGMTDDQSKRPEHFDEYSQYFGITREKNIKDE